jgi:hypothetical protein
MTKRQKYAPIPDCQKSKLNNHLLDVIIVALRGYIHTKDYKQSGIFSVADDDSLESRKSGTINFSYLLGQSIRQWLIPSENWHISEAAMIVWKLIAVDDEIIDERGYKESFECKSEAKDIIIPRFLGTAKDFAKIDFDFKPCAKKSRVFNDLFIAEHTTPVAGIKDALEECYRDFYQKRRDSSIPDEKKPKSLRKEIRKILDKIHITQMLKIEDRRINECSARVKNIEGVKELDPDIKKAVYKYLSQTSYKDVFKGLWAACYKDLDYLEGKKGRVIPDTQAYNDALSIAQKEENSKWAKAIILNESYTIEIAEKKSL